MKLLAVGDSYMDVGVFERALGDAAGRHDAQFERLDEARVLEPRTESERRIREYMGHPDQLVELIDGHEALLVHGAPVTEAVLDGAAQLRVVCCARGGPVNVDVGEATRRGITVVTTPGKNAEAVADLTLGFIVMLARGVPSAQRHLLEGGGVGQSSFEGAQFFGHDLKGLSLGLVGLGQVGTRVARRAVAFGMEVLGFDPNVADGGEVARARDLDDLLARADVVSVHARATAETANLFDARAFAAMRPGALFVNTARETLVDETALAEALAAGRLAGAALDVLRPVAPGERHPLLDSDRVIVTPHIGGATYETLARGARMLADDLDRIEAGEAPLHAINRPELEPA